VSHLQIICDFDGTISKEDVTDGILSRFAAPQWRDVEDAWKAGKIGSLACMSDQFALIRAPLRDIDAYLDTVEIDSGFPAFVDFCRRNRLALKIVSDGVDYAIERILRRFGLGGVPFAANKFMVRDNDTCRLEFPHSSPHCDVSAGTCKCQIAGRGLVSPSGDAQLILIGDGTSDFCIADRADLIFAKEKLLTRCRTKGLPHIPFVRFQDVQTQLAEFLNATSLDRGEFVV
jgi:2-hydroxy-3-keto-5-methylthiopentenyl-1-phosphate phosphatase